MAYENVKMVKIISGEMLLGEMQDNGDLINAVQVQAIPTASGSFQVMVLPFGFPFDQDTDVKIEKQHVIYIYRNTPQDIVEKYIETKTDIRIEKNTNGLIL